MWARKDSHCVIIIVIDKSTGMVLILESKVQCLFCFEICTPGGEEKGGSANFKMKHTEPLTQEITPPLYTLSNCLIMYLFGEIRNTLGIPFLISSASFVSVWLVDRGGHCDWTPQPGHRLHDGQRSHGKRANIMHLALVKFSSIN